MEEDRDVKFSKENPHSSKKDQGESEFAPVTEVHAGDISPLPGTLPALSPLPPESLAPAVTYDTIKLQGYDLSVSGRPGLNLPSAPEERKPQADRKQGEHTSVRPLAPVRTHRNQSAFRMRGLPNVGATCYMSAILQSLLHQQTFIADLNTFSERYSQALKPESLTETLLELTSANRLPHAKIKRLLENVLEAASTVTVSFLDGRMMDAHEFLTNVLSSLEEETTKVAKNQESAEDADSSGSADVQSGKRGQERDAGGDSVDGTKNTSAQDSGTDTGSSEDDDSQSEDSGPSIESPDVTKTLADIDSSGNIDIRSEDSHAESDSSESIVIHSEESDQESGTGPDRGDNKDVHSRESGDNKDVHSKESGDNKDVYSKESGENKDVHSKESGDNKDVHSKESGDNKDVHSRKSGDNKDIHSKESGDSKDVHSKESGDNKDVHSRESGDNKDVHSKESGDNKDVHSREGGADIDNSSKTEDIFSAESQGEHKEGNDCYVQSSETAQKSEPNWDIDRKTKDSSEKESTKSDDMFSKIETGQPMDINPGTGECLQAAAQARVGRKRSSSRESSSDCSPTKQCSPRKQRSYATGSQVDCSSTDKQSRVNDQEQPNKGSNIESPMDVEVQDSSWSSPKKEEEMSVSFSPDVTRNINTEEADSDKAVMLQSYMKDKSCPCMKRTEVNISTATCCPHCQGLEETDESVKDKNASENDRLSPSRESGLNTKADQSAPEVLAVTDKAVNVKNETSSTSAEMTVKPSSATDILATEKTSISERSTPEAGVEDSLPAEEISNTEKNKLCSGEKTETSCEENIQTESKTALFDVEFSFEDMGSLPEQIEMLDQFALYQYKEALSKRLAELQLKFAETGGEKTLPAENEEAVREKTELAEDKQEDIKTRAEDAADKAAASGDQSPPARPQPVDDNPIRANFGFDLKHSITCGNCSEVREQTEQHTSLMLSMPTATAGRSSTLQTALNEYFQKEEMDYTCQHCTQNAKSQSQYQLETFPRILILMLGRYDLGGRKLQQRVEVDYHLFLSGRTRDARPHSLPSMPKTSPDTLPPLAAALPSAGASKSAKMDYTSFEDLSSPEGSTTGSRSTRKMKKRDQNERQQAREKMNKVRRNLDESFGEAPDVSGEPAVPSKEQGTPCLLNIPPLLHSQSSKADTLDGGSWSELPRAIDPETLACLNDEEQLQYAIFLSQQDQHVPQAKLSENKDAPSAESLRDALISAACSESTDSCSEGKDSPPQQSQCGCMKMGMDKTNKSTDSEKVTVMKPHKHVFHGTRKQQHQPQDVSSKNLKEGSSKPSADTVPTDAAGAVQAMCGSIGSVGCMSSTQDRVETWITDAARQAKDDKGLDTSMDFSDISYSDDDDGQTKTDKPASVEEKKVTEDEQDIYPCSIEPMSEEQQIELAMKLSLMDQGDMDQNIFAVPEIPISKQVPSQHMTSSSSPPRTTSPEPCPILQSGTDQQCPVMSPTRGQKEVVDTSRSDQNMDCEKAESSTTLRDPDRNTLPPVSSSREGVDRKEHVCGDSEEVDMSCESIEVDQREGSGPVVDTEHGDHLQTDTADDDTENREHQGGSTDQTDSTPPVCTDVNGNETGESVSVVDREMDTGRCMSQPHRKSCPASSAGTDMENKKNAPPPGRSFTAKDRQTDRLVTYVLVSAVAHYGETSVTGHYVSYVYNMQQHKWYKCNDTDVESCQDSSMEEDCRERGYIFFYLDADIFNELSQQNLSVMDQP